MPLSLTTIRSQFCLRERGRIGESSQLPWIDQVHREHSLRDTSSLPSKWLLSRYRTFGIERKRYSQRWGSASAIFFSTMRPPFSVTQESELKCSWDYTISQKPCRIGTHYLPCSKARPRKETYAEHPCFPTALPK